MGGPSSNPIRCANQDSERKDLGRGIGPEENSERKDPDRGIDPKGNSERKEPFKSKCDSGTCWDCFMAYDVI